MVLFAILVLVIARAYPAGLLGFCRAAGRRLAQGPSLAPLLMPQRRED